MMRMTRSAHDAALLVVRGYQARGLRVAARAGGGVHAVAIGPADHPDDEDIVAEADGIPVFLDPEAAWLLDGKVLDAVLEPNLVRWLILPASAAGSPSDLEAVEAVDATDDPEDDLDDAGDAAPPIVPSLHEVDRDRLVAAWGRDLDLLVAFDAYCAARAA